MDTAEREFEVGFVMAGAVSAGAYSAGVMDFITEALDAYEVARTTGRTAEGEPWDGPTHRVRVPVIAGASAGGMTAAITSLCWFTDLAHLGPGEPPGPEANRLYASWVDEIDIDPLLDPGGLEKGVRSVLNCAALDRIVANTLTAERKRRTRTWLGRGERSDVALIMTASNLRGVPYAFKLFGADENEFYGMLNHGDAMRFMLGAPPDPASSTSGYVPVNADELPLRGKPDASSPWLALHQAVLATGAFPIGLEARVLAREFDDYFVNQPVEFLNEKHELEPLDPHAPRRQARYEFVAVDGGVINNEPFEMARRYLARGARRNERDSIEAKKAMILVDPFPNRADLPKAPEIKDVRLVHMLPDFLGAVIDQARFKPEELALAQNDRVFSRFAIVPSRPAVNEASKMFPIACGVLGGFGGFLHRSFRRHDYLLGRRNAQAFLRWSFMLAEGNSLFDGFRGKPGAERWHVKRPPDGERSVAPSEDRDAPRAEVATRVEGGASEWAYPIVPLTPRMLTPVEIPDRELPRPEAVDRGRIETRLDERLSAVIGTFLRTDLPEVVPLNPLARHGRFIVQPFLVHVAKRMAMKKVDEGLRCIWDAFPRSR